MQTKMSIVGIESRAQPFAIGIFVMIGDTVTMM